MGVGGEVDGKGNGFFVCWFSLFVRNALWELHFVIVFFFLDFCVEFFCCFSCLELCSAGPKKIRERPSLS